MKLTIQWKVKGRLRACKDLCIRFKIRLNGCVLGMEGYYNLGLGFTTWVWASGNGKQNGNYYFGFTGWKTRWKLRLKVLTWKLYVLHYSGIFTGCYTDPFPFP